MRCRGAKFLSSTCAANTAVSSSSSKANSGTCFSTSGLQPIGHLFCKNWIGPQSSNRLIRAQQSTTAPIVNPMNGMASSRIRQAWGGDRGVATRQTMADASRHDLNLQVLSRGMLRQQRGDSLRPAIETLSAAKRNDDRQHLLRRARHHRSFRITGWTSVRPGGVAEYRQSFQIQIVLADAFVGFASASRTKNNFAGHMRQVIKANWQAALHRHQIDHVHDGVDLR